MQKTLMPVVLLGLGALLAVGQSSRPAASKATPAGASFESTIRLFLAKSCSGCRNEKTKSGQLDLTQYTTRAANRDGSPGHVSHIGIFSGGTIDPAAFAQVTDVKKKSKLVFISYGSREFANPNPQRAESDTRASVEALRQAPSIPFSTPHEWHTWRRSLHGLTPLLFQK